MPSGPDILLAGPERRGWAAVRAKPALLTPLAAGEHTISFTERYRGFRRTVMYEISAG